MFELKKQPNSYQKILSKEDNKLFLNLKNHVFNLDEKKIDDWFQKLHLSDQDLENLTTTILQSTYFFSFQGMQDILYKMNQQMKMVIPYFSTKSINLFLQNEFEIENFDNELWQIYFEKANKENTLSNFYSSSSIVKLLVSLLHQEKFERLDEIEKILGKKLHEISTKNIPFFYEEKNMRGCYYVRLSQNIKINNIIILDYSNQKKEFYQKRNIPLTSEKDMLNIKNLILDFFENQKIEQNYNLYHQDMLKNIVQNINIYEKVFYAENLEKKLTKSKIIKKPNKI